MNRTNAHVAKELNNSGYQPSNSMNSPNQVQLKLEVAPHVVGIKAKDEMERPKFMPTFNYIPSGTNWWNVYFRRLSYVLTMFTCFRILSPNILIRKAPCYI